MNDIDQLLEKAMSGGGIDPSPFFTARVMDSVRRQARTPPIAFPLARVAAAFALLVVTIAGGVAVYEPDPPPRPPAGTIR